MDPPAPANEAARLARLREYGALEPRAAEALANLARLAAGLCRAPVAFVSLVDGSRLRFPARVGFEAAEAPRARSFCAKTILGGAPFEVEDARADARFRDAPMVAGEPGLRFYAGAPLVTEDGLAVGALAVADRKPRRLTAPQRDGLVRLARQAALVLETGRAVSELRANRAALEGSRRLFEDAQRIARIGSWRLDPADRSVNCSREMLRLFGLSGLGRAPALEDLAARVHPDDREAFVRRFAEASEGAAPLDFVHRVVRPDGAERVLHERGEPETDAGGRAVALRGTAQDVSRQHRLTAEMDTVFDLALELLCVVDLDGRFRRLSPSWSAALGHPQSEMIGVPFLDFVHPDDVERTRAIWPRVKSGEPVTGFENRYRARDGGYRSLVWSAVTLVSRGLVFASARDVTEARSAAERLHVSEERFRLAALAARDVIWDWDLRRGALGFNDAFQTQFGHRPPEPASRAFWSDHVHPEDRARVEAGLRGAMAGGGETWQDEYRFLRADGTWARVRDRGFIVRDASGAPRRLVGCISDVTELREHAELLNQASDAVFVLDGRGVVIHANAAAGRALERPAAELLGTRAEDLPVFEGAQLREALHEVAETGAWSGELRGAGPSGGARIYDARFSRVDSFDGRSPAALAALTDVTDKRKLEAQFVRAQRLESIGTLAGGVAHDLNNVLAPILVAGELLELDARGDRERELARTIRDCARRGADLVRQVLSFARGVDGALVEVDLAGLLGDLRRVLREAFPPQIACRVGAAPDLATVRGDPAQLRQVLLNLCANARDAMPSGGRLTVTAANVELDAQYAGMIAGARPGRYAQIAVTDDGVGIPQHLQGRVFEPFFTTKEVGKGTGLGLSTVHALVKRHGGFLNLYSEVGKGTTVKVNLPALERAPQVPAAAPTDLPRGQGETLLLIDDEAAIRAISQQTLEACGYSVLLAADGAEGIAMYAQHRDRIALVLTDMKMPIMDGQAVIRALQSMNRGVRILALSGLGDNDPAARAAGAGVRHFLPKPYTAELLLRAIRAALAD